MAIAPASVTMDAHTGVVHCSGRWTVRHLAGAERALASIAGGDTGGLLLELSRIDTIDSAGAWLLQRAMDRWRSEGSEITVEGQSPRTTELLDLVGPLRGRQILPEPGLRPLPFETLGRTAAGMTRESLAFLAFIGRVTVVTIPRLVLPWRLRWASVLHYVQTAGFDALPIVGLLSFLVGVVTAYQGGIQLQLYGANIYVADLVSLSIIRELAPLITAIIVAGRTGAAYTAQIGTMMVTEEVDALRSMAVDPLERLVTPRLIGLLVALPLLTVFAMVAGLAGGLLVANLLLGVGPATFAERMGRTVTLASFLIGVGKTPVFAAVIAGVGCFRGLQVSGSAESVGRQTTVSVVQSIFLVIVADAFFSVIYSEVGL